MKKMHFELQFDGKILTKIEDYFELHSPLLLTVLLTMFSILAFYFFYINRLSIAYNDARSHLDIARRVVEGLKPGFAQLGSVWLPLPHILMLPTIWNDFFWHTGLSGGIISMISYIATGILIYLFLQRLGVGNLARWVGVLVFALNINILYLQSTSMTELLLLATMTASGYYLLGWFQQRKLADLVKCAFYLMLSTLTRYDGWFLLMITVAILGGYYIKKRQYKKAEGIIIFFSTLSCLGIALWFLWNQLIFKDALYFAFGPYSAHTQQLQLEQAGNLATKHNLFYSLQIYFYALFYNVNTFIALIGFAGFAVFLKSKFVDFKTKLASLTLTAPLLFNIIALYFGHSVLFIQGLSGNTWFNVRYGIMVIPFIAIFCGYLVRKIDPFRLTLIALIAFMVIFSFTSFDAVTIDDARVGSSQKNVSEVSGWLAQNTKDKPGFVLISAASHDAIIFSSGLPMKRFIHEGTGKYWDQATTTPDLWARWIIMRTNDDSDATFKLIKNTDGFKHYHLVKNYPFADIYELDNIYLEGLNTQASLLSQN
jgi:hypothetical protein